MFLCVCAVLLALASPEFDVLGITTVAGNVPQPLVTTNALKLCELVGRTDVRVFAGADQPLERALFTAEYVHGPTGIDGADLPPPVTTASAKDAVYWRKRIRLEKKKLSETPASSSVDVAASGLSRVSSQTTANKTKSIIMLPYF